MSHCVAPDLLEAMGGHVDIRFVGVLASASPAHDRAHARCVAYVRRRLEHAGFEVVTEMESRVGRWHGFVDVLACQPVSTGSSPSR